MTTTNLPFGDWLATLPLDFTDLNQESYSRLIVKAHGQYVANLQTQRYWSYIKMRYPEIANEAKASVKGSSHISNDGGGDWE